jgi:hypothetical protein
VEELKPKESGINLSSNGVEAIATIKGSKKNFNQQDVKRAEATRRFQHVTGHLSGETIRHTARTNGIKNSPNTVRDVDMMNDILDVSPYRLKGKFIRQQPDEVETNLIPLSKSVEDHYKDVTLYIYNPLFKSCRIAPQCLRKTKSQQSTRRLFYIIVLFTPVHLRICPR